MKAHATLDDRLAFAFREVAARRPSDSDLKALRRAYDRQSAFYASDEKAARALLGVGASKRDESLKFFADRGHRQVIAGFYDAPVSSKTKAWKASAATVDGVIDSVMRGYKIANTTPKGPVYIAFDSGLQEQNLLATDEQG